MENVSNKNMDNTFEIIANVSAIATLISFVIGFVWNYNSNKQAEKTNFRMCKKFAENIILKSYEENKIGFVSPERRYEAPTVARPPQM